MDMIARAMAKNQHLCKSLDLESQTWEFFEKNQEDKKLFLFGTGGGMGYFLRNCCNHAEVYGVVDNSFDRQKQTLGWCCAEAGYTKYEEIVIDSPEVLRTYPKDEIVVLITNINGFYAIVEQLKQMGIVHIYSLLMLEANKRKSTKVRGVEEDLEGIQSEYIDWWPPASHSR